jgi:Zn-dependent peptidase ImmA (M78 family)
MGPELMAELEHDPIPTGVAKPVVHRFAEDCAAKLGFAPGDAIKPLVSRLGGRVEYKAAIGSDSKIPESIVVRSRKEFTIFVSSMTSQERDRFTIAHELGHLFLHYPMVEKKFPGGIMVATRWVDESNADQQRAEWEANWFAAGFLMPSKEFAATFKSLGGEISSVAAKFGVSAPAATVRAKSLSLL